MGAGRETLIVTGGCRGIGAAISRLAATRDCAIAVNYYAIKASAVALVDKMQIGGGSAVAIQAETGKETDILRLFEVLSKRSDLYAGW